jgi:hypothetical protein
MRQLNNKHLDTTEGASALPGEIVSSQFAPSCQKDENQMKKLFGQFTDTLNTVEIGEVVDMCNTYSTLGVCTDIHYNENGIRDFVIFHNYKKDGSAGKLSKCFIKRESYINLGLESGWKDCHPYVEWKRR